MFNLLVPFALLFGGVFWAILAIRSTCSLIMASIQFSGADELHFHVLRSLSEERELSASEKNQFEELSGKRPNFFPVVFLWGLASFHAGLGGLLLRWLVGENAPDWVKILFFAGLIAIVVVFFLARSGNSK
jgi:hypothetical protein